MGDLRLHLQCTTPFHGTNKSAKLLNENARISWENITAVSFPTHAGKHHSGNSSHAGVRSDSELDELVKSFDLFEYLKEHNGGFRRTESGAVFHNCEICSHHDNLMYVKETNTFYCHSKAVGGSIIDYLIHAEGLTKAQAIDKLKHELCEPKWSTPIPFDEVKLPSFPVDAFPAPLYDWVKAVAENTETPVDMAAVCALAVLSCALQGKFIVHAKSGYDELLNLYILIIANSGERKSPIVRMMTRPIYKYEDIDLEEVPIGDGNQTYRHLNENVLIEIGAAIALYGKRVILLCKKGTLLPSNLQGLYRCEYEGNQLDYASTMKLLKTMQELRTMM